MSNQSMYAMYVIGQVESNHNWQSVSHTDPITLGMMQWFGNRAWGLMNLGRTEDPNGFAQFAKDDRELADSVKNNNQSWATYYPDAVDVNAWINWAKRDENHAFQQKQWETDYTAYSKVCDNVGIPADNIQVRILFMTAYHQSPARALRVIRSVSVMATLERLHSGLLADGILGRYANRYNTAYNLLKNWDGKAAPPNFGQANDNPGDGDKGGGDSKPATTPTPDKPQTIVQVGDNLYLYTGDKQTQFNKSSAQNWTAKTITGKKIHGGTNGDNKTTTGGGSGSGAPSGDAAKVLDWVKARLGKFRYSQGAGRLNPDATGYTDCSGLIWSAYHFTIGVTVGTWTGAEMSMGTLVAQSGSTSIADAIKKVKPADILLLDWGRITTSYDHEEIFLGDGGDGVYSHGGPGNGPTQKSGSQQMGYASRWMIRRHL